MDPIDGSLDEDSFSVNQGAAAIVFDVPDHPYIQPTDKGDQSAWVALVDEDMRVLDSWRLLVGAVEQCILP